MFDSTQQSAHVLLHAKICEEDLFVRQVEKTSSNTDKGGFIIIIYCLIQTTRSISTNYSTKIINEQ